MENKVNQDTGLTPQEEEELLALNPEEEVIINEEDEALLNEFEGFNWDLFPSSKRDPGSVPEYVKAEFSRDKDFRDPLNLNDLNLRTSTPMKKSILGNSSALGKTSPAHQENGLGGFKIPRTTTVIRTRTPQKGPDPEPEHKIVAEIETISRKRADLRPKKKQTQPRNPEREVELLEEGEIDPIDKENPQEKKMGNKTSLPRVLRAVVDVLEEGEIKEEPIIPQDPAPLAEAPRPSPGGEVPERSRVGNESTCPA